jgi:hypothetical protein
MLGQLANVFCRKDFKKMSISVLFNVFDANKKMAIRRDIISSFAQLVLLKLSFAMPLITNFRYPSTFHSQ